MRKMPGLRRDPEEKGQQRRKEEDSSQIVMFVARVAKPRNSAWARAFRILNIGHFDLRDSSLFSFIFLLHPLFRRLFCSRLNPRVRMFIEAEKEKLTKEPNP